MSGKHGLNLIKTIKNIPTSQNLELIYNDLLYFQSKSNFAKNTNEICELINTIGNYLIEFEKQENESENIFDTFCCLDFMSEFVKLSSYGIYEIDLQLIKTLSFLLINIKNKTFLYFLFSKNLLNKIISQNYSTYDDDFLSYYINFLKSLSLLLDKTSIQLFYIQKYNIFPLAENVIKFYNHKDSMIRNVVRSTVINILKVNDDKIQEHFCMLPSILYFVNIVKDLVDLCNKIKYEINMNNKKQILYLFDDLYDEIIYIDDLLNLKLEKINYVLINCLFYYLIMPIIIGGICSKNKKFPLSFSLFLLVFFFMNIKDETFKNCLFAILFLDSFPVNGSIEYFLKIDNIEYINVQNYLRSLGSSEDNENNQRNENLIPFFEFISSHYTYQFFLTIIRNDSNINYYNYSQNYPKLSEIINNNKQLCEKINENTFKNTQTLSKEINDNLNSITDSILTCEEKINLKKYHEYLRECTGIFIGNFYKDYTTNKNIELIYDKNFLCFMNEVFSNIKNNKNINDNNTNIIKEKFFSLISSKNEEVLLLLNILVFIVQYKDTKINPNLLKIAGIENMFTKKILNQKFKNIDNNVNKSTKSNINDNLKIKLNFGKNNFNFNYNFFSCLDDENIKIKHNLFLPELLSKIFVL